MIIKRSKINKYVVINNEYFSDNEYVSINFNLLLMKNRSLFIII